MPPAVYILFAYVLTTLASIGAGRILLSRWSLPFYRQEFLAFSFLAGSACLSLAVFLLATAQLLHKGIFLALGVLVVAIAWQTRVPSRSALPPLPKWLMLVFAVPFAAFFALTFLHAMAPEVSPDGTAYHLGLVARYYRERGFSRLTTNMYANLSQAMEMIFLFAYGLGRHSAAAMAHFNFLVALAWLVSCYGRRFGFPVASTIAAFIVFVTPVIGIDAASAYNDVAVAAVLFGGFYLLEIWRGNRSRSLIVLAGILAGFAYGIKYTAFLAVPFGVVYVVWFSRGRLRELTRPLAAAALAATLWAAPWAIKNAVILGNPVSPFFNRVFPNPFVKVSFEEEYRHHMRNYMGLASHTDIPLEVTVRGQILCGLTGPLFLLSPLALLALRRPEGRRLLLAGLVFGSVYATNIGTRFLIPAIPFLALAMAMALDRYRPILVTLALAHAVSAWPPVLKTYAHQYAWRLDKFEWRAALRLVDEMEYVTRKSNTTAIARFLESHTAPGSRILSFNQTGEAYMTRDFLVVYQSAIGARLGEILWVPLAPEYQPTRRVVFDFPAVAVSRVNVRQTASHPVDAWIVNEVRLYHNAAELPRAPNWLLTANPFPWTIGDAFDNSPVTRWNSSRALSPGMSVTAVLPSPTSVDRVAVDLPGDPRAPRYELDLDLADGSRRTLTSPREVGLSPPLELRREATAVLKDNGITHLLVSLGDFGAADFENRTTDWNLRKIGTIIDATLYELQ